MLEAFGSCYLLGVLEPGSFSTVGFNLAKQESIT